LDKNLQYCSFLKADNCPSDRWSTWYEGFGASANLAGDGNANGLNYSTGGVLIGAERRFSECTKIGLVGGYSSSFVALDDSDTASIDGGQLAAFLHRDFEQLYFTGIAAYGYNSYGATRQIEFAAIDRTAHANYAGNNFSFYSEIGRTLYGRRIHMQPFAALEYINVRQNDFTETGADSIDIASNGETADAFRGLLGTRVFSNIATESGHVVTLEGRAAWRHEFLNESRVLDASFAGVPGSSFAISGVNVDRDMGIFGLGSTYHFSTRLALFAGYDAAVSQNYTSHTGSGGMQLTW
jgi:outer membrane autotransporter protein